MALRLRSTQPDFTDAFARLLAGRAQRNRAIAGTVEAILDDVAQRGDAALVEYTRRFDRWEADAHTIRVSAQEIANAVAVCSPELLTSLKKAAARIALYAQAQLPEDKQWRDDTGVTLGWRWTPLDAVGLYVPGGLASYPSSVLMNAVPARVAGVSRLVMVVPAPEGAVNPAVLAAAHVAGIEEIYKVGGAQAVAALAYGTQSIAAVDKIVGPGNAYVAEAKRQVFGQVGIDMIAGPSEILVVADKHNNPDWIAADLLSQCEHDEVAQSVLITDEAAFADQVEAAAQLILATLPRRAIAQASWEKESCLIVVESLVDTPALVDRIAPEHLELAVAQPEALAARIRHAGAIFLGKYTPEAIGDYIAGPSHVLPTSRTARFASGLGTLDFLKRTSLISCDETSFHGLAMYGETLADAEGLQAHGLSMRVRRQTP